MSLNIQSLLESMGYNLIDRGEYWQSSAIYRGGDNPNALQIYKDSGVWKDYVRESSFFPFSALIEKTLGPTEAAKFSISNSSNLNPTPKETVVKLEKIFQFSDTEIASLLPHYSFYNSKNISNQTLKFLKSGMCTFGAMYQRYVFPIYNKHNKVHGVAGRDMGKDSSRPKWKHMGRKTEWIYPLYAKDDKDGSLPIYDAIASSREVVLVESIGDMLSLHEAGLKNVLVTFGVSISASLCSILMGLSPEKIFICLNNDFDKEVNVGKLSSIKCFLKLLSWFSSDKLYICLPIKNDFGVMTKDDFAEWLVKKRSIAGNHKKLCSNILKEVNSLKRKNMLSKNLLKNISHLNCDG